MDLVSQSITWPTTTQETWIREAEKVRDVFFSNRSVTTLRIALPVAFSLIILSPPSGGYLRRNNKKHIITRQLSSFSNSGIIIKHPYIDKNSKCSYQLMKTDQLLKATTDLRKHVLKIDFTELVFQQNLDSASIGFSQALPPIAFKGELNSDLSNIDIPLEFQLQSDTVILNYYFSDFTKIRERLNDFIKTCSVFYTVYCQQPTLAEKEDHSLEVKWS
jgi:hypothetical protein